MENLSGMNDGGNFPRDILKPIFNSIKNEKLVWAQDQPADNPKVGIRPILRVYLLLWALICFKEGKGCFKCCRINKKAMTTLDLPT